MPNLKDLLKVALFSNLTSAFSLIILIERNKSKIHKETTSARAATAIIQD